MLTTLIILIIATALFIDGRIKSDLVAVGSLIALILTGIITPSEAWEGFSNSVVVMIAGLFIVGAGIFNSGLANILSNRILKFGKNNETKMLIIIMLTVGITSAFMSNTGTVAIMLPVVVSIALGMKASPAKFLMPLAFASSLGGIITLIGTPPNLVASNALVEAGFKGFSFFEFAPIGIIVLITGTLFMATIGKKLLPNRIPEVAITGSTSSAKKLAGVYKIYPTLHFLSIPNTSNLVGKKLENIQLPTKYGMTVIAIKRSSNGILPLGQQYNQIIPKSHTILQAGDTLLVMCPQENIERGKQDYDIEQLANHSEAEARNSFLNQKFGIAEIIITPQSLYRNKSIRDLHFRKKLGLTALAINRNGKLIYLDVAKEKLRTGDAILIHGEWSKIELLNEDSHDVVVVGNIKDIANTYASAGKAWIAGIIMLAMLIVMTMEVMDPVVTVFISAVLMLITGCVRSTKDAYHSIDWESLILIAAMLPMATALEKTGGVQLISDFVIDTVGNYGPFAVLIGFYILTTVLSQFISNTAAAVIFAPIALHAAIHLDVSPYPFIMAIAIAASMAFSTPVASPTNALVMNAGGYKFSDFVKVGVPLQVAVAIVALIFLPLFFPF